MLKRPPTCEGCPLHPLSTGFMKPTTASSNPPYNVALIGDTLGEDEASIGSPFTGRAGFKLTRLIEWAGLDRSKFGIFNTTWCQPPDNKLEGTPYELQAINHCRQHHWGHLLSSYKVLVPMGNVAVGALLNRKGILSIRGYPAPGPDGTWIVPTVHPTFIQRGQSRYSAAFINDVQKAVSIAREGFPPQFLNYLLDPSPASAYNWAQGYLSALRANPALKLAFDIETPGKGDEEDDLDVGDLDDKTWFIWRIGFSYAGGSALSVPWDPTFIPIIKILLGTSGPKVVWNAGFDVPRIRRQGVLINGLIHDAMVAWHILHSDLPKSLKFVATFTCPFQTAWKHLSGAKPAFYNATDADVEWRSMEVIESELRRTGLWDVYQRDVLDLDPILVYMQTKGMPVDRDVRLDRAIKLRDRFVACKESLSGAIPLDARRIAHAYTNRPTDITGLLNRPGTRQTTKCPACGVVKPRKDHFKSFVKKVNPCAGLVPETCVVSVEEFYRLAEFTPSRDQLIRYHQFLNRPLPLVYDKQTRKKKISFGERQVKDLIGKFPIDAVYPLVLQYRSLDKIAGTYIGRPVD